MRSFQYISLTIIYQLSQVIIKDPENSQDPAGIRTQDFLITSQTLLPLSHWISCGRLCMYMYISEGR